MIVRLDAASRLACVAEGDVLTSLSVERRGGSLDWLAPTIGRLDADGGHLWVEIAWLRNAARPSSAAPDWERGFDKMIAYATGKGWVDASGRAVRAHIVDGNE